MSAPLQRFDLLTARLGRLSNAAGPVSRGDPSAIHRARVASRRLRELVPILGLDSRAAHKLDKRLRRLTNRLGEIRELGVLGRQAEALRAKGCPGSHALELVQEGVQAERKKAHRSAAKSIRATLARVDRHLHEIADKLKDADTSGAGRRWVWALDARVVRRAAALRRAVERSGAAYRPKRLHAVRVAVKKARYGLELALDASGADDRTDLAVLEHAQDLLGRLHDLQILIERVRAVQASGESSSVMGWHEFDALVKHLEGDARRLHARYVRSMPALVDAGNRLAEPSPSAGRRPLRRTG